MKTCSHCKKSLAISEFYREKRSGDGFQSWCRKCTNEYRKYHYKNNDIYRARTRERNKKNFDKNRPAFILRVRKSEILRKYGISWDRYQEILSEQGDKCGLCGCASPGGKGNWHVDHCHDSGAIRGLLCNRCNLNLGTYERLKKQFGFEKIETWIKRGKDALRQRKAA